MTNNEILIINNNIYIANILYKKKIAFLFSEE